MLLGTPASGNTGIAVSQSPAPGSMERICRTTGRSTRKLTLNLGIRWEFERPVTDRFNRLSTFNYNAINPDQRRGRPELSRAAGVRDFRQARASTNTNYKHFAPRIGFAYQLMPKLVMRGGYGIFFPRQYPGVSGVPGLPPIRLTLLRTMVA